jgi:uncharacterized membrane protein
MDEAVSSSRQLALFHQEVRAYRGPIPDPETLAQYKHVDPSFPERIMRMAESQHEHRLGVERDTAACQRKVLVVTTCAVFALAVLCVCGAAFMGYVGNTGVALALAPLGFLSPVVSLVLKWRSDREARNKEHTKEP